MVRELSYSCYVIFAEELVMGAFLNTLTYYCLSPLDLSAFLPPGIENNLYI